MENKKIDALLAAYAQLRAEKLETLKIIHSILMAMLTLICVSAGSYIALKSANVTKEYSLDLFAFIISQIEFTIILHANYLNLNMFSVSAYLSIIEEKINKSLREDIIFWESKVSLMSDNERVIKTTLIILYIIYALFFIFLISLSININIVKLKLEYAKVKWWSYFFLGIQIIEFLTTIYITWDLTKHIQKVREKIKRLEKLEINYIYTICLYISQKNRQYELSVFLYKELIFYKL